MAERRMFAKTIIDSDAFLDMPQSTQLLYFHLSMRGDDDGFINNPKKIARMIGASDDDLKLLTAKKFIIPFESGVVVIKHWKIHNYIQKDRYTPTKYIEERGFLELDENKAYTLDTECIQNVYTLDTQVRLGKDRLGKDRLGKYVSTGARTRESDAVENSSFVENSVENSKDDNFEVIEQTDTEDDDDLGYFVFDEEEETLSDDDGKQILGGEGDIRTETDGRTDKRDELKFIGGEIGQGVLLLSDRQMEELIDKMGLVAFNEYARRVSDYIINKDAKITSCYATILKWWKEDMERGKYRG